ncbi:NRAMP family divalent metal transporter [Spirochaeta cellobiosiphila]|uniref:NRAMP family divalent metal transporter n=1 Tax=Spirochaeta cellobiosiphila TaxID=504483 RepID=UPI000417C375|nr:divalent metal cation transporter [Spirochaeta cellobiosiphila]
MGEVKVNDSHQTIKDRIKLLGPGIMSAAAAVGGSHLVSSTKAGAIYGWQLALVIILVNLFKYPFFKAGVQYTVGTKESLIEGYSKMGKGYLLLFTVLTFTAAVVNTAALTVFSASLLSYFLPVQLPIMVLDLIVLASCLVLLFAGHYKALDRLAKVIMAVLVVTTLVAVSIAMINGPIAPKSFETPTIWSLSAFGFIVIMMGWMPAPIEISSLTSMWLKSQREKAQVTSKSALFDFNIGYIGTAILAVVFLALGALVLHGNGQEFASTSIGFSKQLVGMYASTIGEWSRYLIAAIAFFCIYGSTITVIDGYSRALAESQRLIMNKTEDNGLHLNIWIVVVSVLAIVILAFFASALMSMLNFAMILSFVTTPIFALLNYILISQTNLEGDLKLGFKGKLLAQLGLIYLFGFLVMFIWYQWLM